MGTISKTEGQECDLHKVAFRNKLNKIYGQVTGNKAILVCKRIDFKETFAPMAILKAIGMILAYAIKVYYMDVKITFMNGYLEEKLYIEQP